MYLRLTSGTTRPGRMYGDLAIALVDCSSRKYLDLPLFLDASIPPNLRRTFIFIR